MEKVKRKSGFKFREKIYMNGKTVLSPFFTRKHDAKLWKREKLAERDRLNALGINYIADITLQQYIETFLLNKSGLAKRTIDCYKSSINLYILPLLGHMKLSKLRLQNGEDIKLHLVKKGLSAVRTNNILNVLKIICKEAVRSENLLKSPFDNLKFVPKQDRDLTYWLPREISSFLRVTVNDELALLYLIALNTGLRKGELCGLCWDCINFDTRQITIKRTMDRYGLKERTKSNKIRVVPMNDTVYTALYNQSLQKKNLEYVFVSNKGHALDYQHISYRHFNKSIEKAKVRKIRFHDLRTTFASNYCMSGGDIYALSKILGHSSVDITQQTYAHLHPNFMEKQINIVNFSPDLALDNLRPINSSMISNV